MCLIVFFLCCLVFLLRKNVFKTPECQGWGEGCGRDQSQIESQIEIVCHVLLKKSVEFLPDE